jgi:hypothetical protein
MPDRVPVEQRGVTAGFVGGMTIQGNVVGLGLAAWLLGGINQHAYSLGMIRFHAGIYYMVKAFLVLVGVLVTVCGVHEIPLLIQGHELSRKKEKTLLEFPQRYMEDWVEPWRSSHFSMVFLTRASLMLGLMLFMTFI